MMILSRKHLFYFPFVFFRSTLKLDEAEVGANSLAHSLTVRGKLYHIVTIHTQNLRHK